MKEYTLGIIGNNYKKTTNLFNDIVMNTKAKTDQEHIKINIVIKKNLDKDKIFKILNNFKKINTTYLIIDIDDNNLNNYIKENTDLIILNNVEDVLKLHEKGEL